MRLVRYGLFALLPGLAFGAPASSQDIASALGRLPVGTLVTWHNSEGPHFTHITRGKDARGYRLDYYEGRAATGPVLGTYWVDGKGQFLRFAWSDGSEVRYSPHSCNRTPGTCRFTETRKGQQPRKLVRVTTPADDGFTYTESDAATGTVTETGAVTLGPNGLNTTGWYRPVGGQRVDLRLVKVAPPG